MKGNATPFIASAFIHLRSPDRRHIEHVARAPVFIVTHRRTHLAKRNLLLLDARALRHGLLSK